jgi:hypothetical protein
MRRTPSTGPIPSTSVRLLAWWFDLERFGDRTTRASRAAKLDEGVVVLKAMLSSEPVDHAGEHYQVTGRAVRSCRRSGVDERLLAPAEDQSEARSALTRRSASRPRLTSRPSAKRSQRPAVPLSTTSPSGHRPTPAQPTTPASPPTPKLASPGDSRTAGGSPSPTSNAGSPPAHPRPAPTGGLGRNQRR